MPLLPVRAAIRLSQRVLPGAQAGGGGGGASAPRRPLHGSDSTGAASAPGGLGSPTSSRHAGAYSQPRGGGRAAASPYGPAPPVPRPRSS